MPATKSQTRFVQENDHNIRLDVFLARQEQVPSRSFAAKLVSEGLVQVNAKIEKVSYKLQPGDEVTFQLPEPTAVSLKPYPLKLKILYEDSDLIVINKPAGLVVHPSAGHETETLVNALIHHTSELSMGFHEMRPGIVHRLDKDTSGLLVVAKNNQAHNFLAKQFKDKTVHRIYNAIVFGEVKNNFLKIESYLGRHPRDRKKFASIDDETKGKWACTELTLLDTYQSDFSLLSCKLQTGRTHQIRVHCSEAGHPIVGDPIYGGRTSRLNNLKSPKLRASIKQMQRIALHAKELGFVHPSSGQEMQFTSGWPDDLMTLVKELEFDKF